MGKASRSKGQRVERRIVQMHRDLGLRAERVPLSGAAGGRFKADVDVYLRGEDAAPFVCEVKARKESAWKTIKAWLSDADALLLVEDRKKPLVVLPWERWEEIVTMLERLRDRRTAA